MLACKKHSTKFLGTEPTYFEADSVDIYIIKCIHDHSTQVSEKPIANLKQLLETLFIKGVENTLSRQALLGEKSSELQAKD